MADDETEYVYSDDEYLYDEEGITLSPGKGVTSPG
jgi:hypothetical protein